jgi:hypothetical protein
MGSTAASAIAGYNKKYNMIWSMINYRIGITGNPLVWIGIAGNTLIRIYRSLPGSLYNPFEVSEFLDRIGIAGNPPVLIGIPRNQPVRIGWVGGIMRVS